MQTTSSSYQDIIGAFNVGDQSVTVQSQKRLDTIFLKDEDANDRLLNTLFSKQNANANSNRKLFSGFVTANRLKTHKTPIDSRMKKFKKSKIGNSSPELQLNTSPSKKEKIQKQLRSLINSHSSRKSQYWLIEFETIAAEKSSISKKNMRVINSRSQRKIRSKNVLPPTRNSYQGLRMKTNDDILHEINNSKSTESLSKLDLTLKSVSPLPSKLKGSVLSLQKSQFL